MPRTFSAFLKAVWGKRWTTPTVSYSLYGQDLLGHIQTTIIRLSSKDAEGKRYKEPDWWADKVLMALGPEINLALQHRKEELRKIIQYYSAAWMLSEMLCMKYNEDLQHGRIKPVGVFHRLFEYLKSHRSKL